jgi:hypothetical protein
MAWPPSRKPKPLGIGQCPLILQGTLPLMQSAIFTAIKVQVLHNIRAQESSPGIIGAKLSLTRGQGVIV